MDQGATQQFTATLTGTNNTAVTWSVQEAGGGTISSSGLYTAPAGAPGTYHVLAASVADPTRVATATVTVRAVTISLDLVSLTLDQADTQQFTATVAGTVNPAVNWTVLELAGGTISAAGLYSAPTHQGTYHVRATSVGDPSKSADATVSVRPVLVALNEVYLEMWQGDTFQFEATVTGTALSEAVSWSVSGPGSVSDTGLFTAPAEAVDLYVSATSVADPSVRADAYVTVAEASIQINPGIASVRRGGTRQFTAAMSGTVFHSGFTWSIAEGAAGGSITSEGLYTAPSAPGVAHVVASCNSDPSRTASVAVEITDGGFRTTTGQMNTGRIYHRATLLNDGTVLLTGGIQYDDDGNPIFLSSAELFDPATETFTPTGPMSRSRYGHTATLLPDGTVLVVGGSTEEQTDTGELYDPATAVFTSVGQPAVSRWRHTATLLNDGTVFLAGGIDIPCDCVADIAEIFDPGNQVFTPVASPMQTGRFWHSATLLADGTVWLAGGRDYCSARGETEIFDPTTGLFTPATSLDFPRSHHTATQLDSGEILLAGGAYFEECSDNYYDFLDNAVLYDPAAATFSSVSMGFERRFHMSTILSNGQVLVAGGHLSTQTAELFDPVTSTFSQTGDMQFPRTGGAATLLPDGRVLITGGSGETAAEIYE